MRRAAVLVSFSLLCLPGKKQIKEGEVCLAPQFQRKLFTMGKAWGRQQVAGNSHIQAEQELGREYGSLAGSLLVPFLLSLQH